MLETMNIRFALVLVLFLLGCENHDLEKNFFKQPLAHRVERLRSHPLADQFKIFRYGNAVVQLFPRSLRVNFERKLKYEIVLTYASFSPVSRAVAHGSAPLATHHS
jgi:hypothetical protein